MKIKRESIPENCQFRSIPNGGTFYISNPTMPCVKIACVLDEKLGDDEDEPNIHNFQLVIGNDEFGVFMEIETGKVNSIQNNMTVNIIDGEFVY